METKWNTRQAVLRARNLFMNCRKGLFLTDELSEMWKCDTKGHASSRVAVVERPAARLAGYILVDSRADRHIINKSDLESIPMGCCQTCATISFSTANGANASRETVLVYIGSLDITIEAYVLANTPSLLSFGALVERGWDFTWDSNGPLLSRENPKGKTVVECRKKASCPEIVARATPTQSNEPNVASTESSPKFYQEISDIVPARTPPVALPR